MDDALGSCLIDGAHGFEISGLGGFLILTLERFVIATQSGLQNGLVLAVAKILLFVGACTLDSRFDVCHSIYPL